MAAALKLRRSEPELERPFRAPLHPWLPLTAIVLSTVAFASVAWSARGVTLLFVSVMTAFVLLFQRRIASVTAPEPGPSP
jgi:ethanolamine permease